MLPDGDYHINTQLNDHDANIAAFGWAMAHYKFDHYLTKTNKKLAILTVAGNCGHRPRQPVGKRKHTCP